MTISEAIQITDAEKSDFDISHIAVCCGGKTGKGRAIYTTHVGYEHREADLDLCTSCLKKYAEHKIKQ